MHDGACTERLEGVVGELPLSDVGPDTSFSIVS
jgi:hypothetical protein